MTDAPKSITLQCKDHAEGGSVCFMLREHDGRLLLCMSVEHDGDVEAEIDKASARRLAAELISIADA